MSRTVPEFAGMRVNKLTLLKKVSIAGRRGVFWMCVCDCGSITTKYGGYIRNRSAVSCGCAMAASKRKHGMSKSPEYKAWDNARSRCYRQKDPKYPLYGGRGISMCEEWRNSFEAFYADMGPRPTSKHSLDRVDGNGHYEPKNCRWATIEEQNNNRSSNRHITVSGVSMTVAQASQKYRIPHHKILARVNCGMSGDEAISHG
jgi:hypothetical protein